MKLRGCLENMRVVELINDCLGRFLAENENSIILGEDILSPYGGAFKATSELSAKYPDRVITTPISEAGIVGFATGAAISGKAVCVEIMFGDFLTLCTDQIINHLSKLPWVYDNQVSAPVVIRTPMGGGRGYGATHSQSLEKHFCGVPGLSVCAISEFSDIGKIYDDAFASMGPVLIIENKSIYPRQLRTNRFRDIADADLAIVTYGGTTELCVSVAEMLEEEEIRVKVIEVNYLSPLDTQTLFAELGQTDVVLSVEEGSPGWSFSSELAHALINRKIRAFKSVTSSDNPIPSSTEQEKECLPSREKIHDAVVQLIEETL